MKLRMDVRYPTSPLLGQSYFLFSSRRGKTYLVRPDCWDPNARLLMATIARHSKTLHNKDERGGFNHLELNFTREIAFKSVFLISF